MKSGLDATPLFLQVDMLKLKQWGHANDFSFLMNDDALDFLVRIKIDKMRSLFLVIILS